MESFLEIAPHSLAIVLSRVGAGEASGAAGVSESDELPRHHTGYEIFADFKAENSQQHVWNQRITEAVSETFFLGWIDEHVLLIQGKEDHLEVLREGWMRRSLNPPRGFTIKYLGKGHTFTLGGLGHHGISDNHPDVDAALCCFNHQLAPSFPDILCLFVVFFRGSDTIKLVRC